MRTIGTVVRGVRAPIIREGDNIAEVAAASVMEAWKEASIEPRDRDVVAVTESVVARAQGNYATLDQIAKDVREKTGGGTVGVDVPHPEPQPLLPAAARHRRWACKKIVLRALLPLRRGGQRPCRLGQARRGRASTRTAMFSTLEQFRKKFGAAVHPFTGVDYVDFYSGIIDRRRALRSRSSSAIACRRCARLHRRRHHAATSTPARAASACSRPRAPSVVLGLDDLLTAPRGRQRLQRRIRPARLQQGRPRRRVKLLPARLHRPLPRSWAQSAQRGQPASTSRPWSTATARSRTPSARSGSWPTRSSPPATPRAWWARPTS